jgi:nitrogen fixation/metabolism regulation signal transduction histidine kinase
MVFKNFRFQVILRGIAIGVTSVGLAWSIYLTTYIMTPLVFGLATLLQLIALIYYVEGSLKEVKRFSDSFIDSDYMRKFDDTDKGQLFKDLGLTFNRIIDDFKRIRIEKEEHYRYLLQVNKHVSIGLICFKEDGRVDLMNQAAASLLNTPMLDRMEHLQHHDEPFHHMLTGMKSGEKKLIKSSFTKEKRDLAIVANKFILNSEEYTLISLQDIRAELDANEMTAWQKLIRVLTHEIMNSVTPVVSLTTAMKMMMEDEEGKPVKVNELDKETGEDIYRSVFAIESRGKGLLSFVNAYRDYTNPPQPEFESVNLFSLTHDVVQIMKSTMEGVNLIIDHESKEGTLVQADNTLISQVLINLIKNAKEALADVEKPEIKLLIENNSARTVVRVKDNGPGISADVKEEIFVPFFTTKEKGNGIGLSLSKQIMKAHHGDLTLDSDEQGARFSLVFNKD